MILGWLALLLAGCPTPAEDDTGPIDDTAGPCGDGVCATDDGEDVDSCPYDCGFRYLLLVDLGNGNGGGTPGADVDAVKLVHDGVEHWVDTVVDADIRGPENEWTDVAELIGPSDSGCETQHFTSLGGRGAWVALSFGEDVPIRAGDVITVYELSAKMCENNGRNDPWELLVANTADPLQGEYVGYGSGLGEVTVDPW